MTYLLFLIYAILSILLIKDDFDDYQVRSWIVIAHLIVLCLILNNFFPLYGALLVLLYSISNKKGNFVDLVYFITTLFIILTSYSILANIWAIPFILIGISYSYYNYRKDQPYLSMILSIQLVYVLASVLGSLI